MRSRDFVLLVLVVAFLIVAITATVSFERGKAESVVLTLETASVGGEEYVAVVDRAEPDRAARIAELKQKLAARDSETVFADTDSEVIELPTSPEITAAVTDFESTTTLAADDILWCDVYTASTVSWPLGDIELVVREGARVVYQVETTMQTVSRGSSTALQGVETERVLAQLPLRTDRLSTDRCLPTDVVGIAQDGSLIRNEDHELYGIFGSETLVGYALDGYPIYGQQTTIATDRCGGAMVAGQYRYYLHPDRPAVLGCFAGVPITL